jgi:hypothetical protein
VPFAPSFKQTAAAVGTTTYRMRQERKARAQQEAGRRVAEARQRSQEEAEVVNAEADSIVREWRLSSPEAREAAFRIISAPEIWDVLARVVA